MCWTNWGWSSKSDLSCQWEVTVCSGEWGHSGDSCYYFTLLLIISIKYHFSARWLNHIFQKNKGNLLWIFNTVVTERPGEIFTIPAKNALLVFPVPHRLQIALRLDVESFTLACLIIRHSWLPWLTTTIISSQMTPPWAGGGLWWRRFISRWMNAIQMCFPMMSDSSVSHPAESFHPDNIADNITHLLHNVMLPTLNSLWPLAFQK